MRTYHVAHSEPDGSGSGSGPGSPGIARRINRSRVPVNLASDALRLGFRGGTCTKWVVIATAAVVPSVVVEHHVFESSYPRTYGLDSAKAGSSVQHLQVHTPGSRGSEGSSQRPRLLCKPARAHAVSLTWRSCVAVSRGDDGVLPVSAVVATESWAATRTGCRTEPEAGQCQLQQLQVQLPQSDLSPSLPESRKPQIHRRPKTKGLPAKLSTRKSRRANTAADSRLTAAAERASLFEHSLGRCRGRDAGGPHLTRGVIVTPHPGEGPSGAPPSRNIVLTLGFE